MSCTLPMPASENHGPIRRRTGAMKAHSPRKADSSSPARRAGDNTS
jgi:hypothetical protein